MIFIHYELIISIIIKIVIFLAKPSQFDKTINLFCLAFLTLEYNWRNMFPLFLYNIFHRSRVQFNGLWSVITMKFWISTTEFLVTMNFSQQSKLWNKNSGLIPSKFKLCEFYLTWICNCSVFINTFNIELCWLNSYILFWYFLC